MSNALRLTIPEPCHEKWKDMTPNEQGRHCISCQKTVVDFSVMSDKEILDYLAQANSNVCGRFDKHQLNRGLHENKFRKRFSLMYVWNLLVMLFLFAGKTKAQGKPMKAPTEKGKTNKLDSIKSCKQDFLVGIVVEKIEKDTTAPNDSASIDALLPDTTAIVDFESDTDSTVMPFNIEPIEKYLQLDTVYIMGETEVVCNTMTLGFTVPELQVPLMERFSRRWDDWFPKDDMVVYPNPLPRGQTMMVALQLKETGQYRMEIIDGNGKVLWIQKLTVPDPKYKISLPTQSNWPAGIYWLRLTAVTTRTVYNKKLLLQ